jgi:hypothetical protein
MMEFNYLAEREAVKREPSGKYVIDYGLIPSAVADLAKELLDMEAKGDRGRTEDWFKKYDLMPADLKASLQNAAGVPVDIDPVFTFKPKVK